MGAVCHHRSKLLCHEDDLLVCKHSSVPTSGIIGEERSCVVQQAEWDLRGPVESRPLVQLPEPWYFIQEEGLALVRGAGRAWWTIQGVSLNGAGFVVGPYRLTAASARNPSGFSGSNIKRCSNKTTTPPDFAGVGLLGFFFGE
jgi:hypothetical protein